jgi:regulation of enolase protein 1 (concanavalin A-like superfamily)
VAAAGSGSSSGTSHTVTGSGSDIWDRSDEFHFHAQSWTGDGTWIAQVTGMTNTDGWAKAGIMLRDGTAPNAAHVFLSVTPSGMPGVFWRSATDGLTDYRALYYSISRVWLKLTRTGSAFQSSVSPDGVTWTTVGGPITVNLPATVVAGLAVTSHRDGVLCTATFEQVSVPTGGTAPPTAVNAPTGLTALAVSSSAINLGWADNAGNETGFQVERGTDNVNFTLMASLAANATSYSDTGLAASTTYYYRVRAVAGTTSSGYSNTASATTASPPPPPPTVNAPTALTASAASSSAINLAWTDNAGNETAFQIERSADNANFTLLASPAANVTSYSDTGLAAGTTYYYRVRAVSGTTASGYSNTASAATMAAPPPPAGSWLHADIGAVGLAGSDDASGITYTVRGSGSDVWDRADAFRFLYRTMTGDGVVEARVTGMTNTNSWAKAGVMIRDSLATGARNAFIFLTPTAGLHSQLRDTTGGLTSSTRGPWGLAAPYWVRLTRSGTRIVAACSADGTTWQTVASYTVALNSEVLVGFAVTAHDNTKLCTATFEDPFVQ